MENLPAGLLRGLLIGGEIAPSALYRFNIQGVTAGGLQTGLRFTDYRTKERTFNPMSSRTEWSTNFFIPVHIANTPVTLRFSSDSFHFDGSSYHQIFGDVGTQLGRFKLRSGYRLTHRDQEQGASFTTNRVLGWIGYHFGNNSALPQPVRNALLRLETEYNVSIQQFERISIQASRSILKHGRIQAGYGYWASLKQHSLDLSIIFDFNRVRSITRARNAGRHSSLSQNLRGSVGYDTHNRNVILNNRFQTGTSGVIIRMFIDQNNSGTYDAGDTLIPVPANAVRIEQAHQKSLIQDGVLHTGLLRAYNRYNVVVNPENLPNPMLIPSVNLFSFYTDPNQFKTIDIPLYHAGIIEGRVLRQVSTDQTHAVSGLRMLLLQADGKYKMTFTTFFDGLFYSMEPPRKLHLKT